MTSGKGAATRVVVLLLLVSLVIASLLVSGRDRSLAQAATRSPSPSAWSPPQPELTGPNVTFAVGGDIDTNSPTFPTMVAELKRSVTRGAGMFMAVGDLGNTVNAQGWCSTAKGILNETFVIPGNHDTTQSGPGDIAQYVIYCPFNLGVSLVAGPEYGYANSYYFDLPAGNPLVRFVMISSGIVSNQTAGMDYRSPSGPDYTWTINAITSAKASNIPWVVVGVHKLCINAGSYGCEIGQGLWDGIITAGADVLFTGHYHTYERSYQLNHNGTACTSVRDGSYNAACVANFNYSSMQKGAGIVQVTNAFAGNPSTYAHNGSADGQYFPVWMASNGNSQSKTNGFGLSLVRLNATTLQGSTTFCPSGSTGSDGECASQEVTTFQDSFTISSGGPPPLTAGFTFTPTNPQPGQSVTFTGTASGGTGPYSFAWAFGDGSTGTGSKASHSYAQVGTYTVNLTVSDAASHAATAIHTVNVGTPALAASFTHSPSNPVAGHAMTLDGTASGGTPPYTYAWDLGDGSSDTGAHVSHVFASPGDYTVDFRVTDAASQAATATHTITVVPGGTAPVTTLTITGQKGTNDWYTTTVLVRLNATGSASTSITIGYRVDRGVWGTYRTPLSLGDGRHSLEYNATDDLGNEEATQTVAVNVDTGPPHLTLSIAGGTYTVSPVVVTWTVSDAIAGLEQNAVRVDGRPYVDVGLSTTSALSLSDGEHTIGVRSTDAAGNAAWANVTLRVDTNVFSPTGPLQGMPTYILIAIVAGTVVFLFLLRRGRAQRRRREQELVRMRARRRA